MSLVTFSDVVFSHISFPDTPFYRLLLRIIDNPWIQRLRDISQTAHTNLVYMTSEHSRFPHSLGVTYMADLALRKMAENVSQEKRVHIEEYHEAVVLSALLHDVGHLAPGSHVAFRIFFTEDDHEEISIKIIDHLQDIPYNLKDIIKLILSKSPLVPKWCHQIISGSGWNVDRGNWCVLDSVLAGVKYGFYNINAILESLTLTENGELAIQENRIDALIHFSVSRYALYRQVYQHRVILGIDALYVALGRAIREFGVNFMDPSMRTFLTCDKGVHLPLDVIFRSRESWWLYHLMQWQESSNHPIVADLARRLLNRDLFKTLPHSLEVEETALRLICDNCLNSDYYYHVISTKSIEDGDSTNSLKVVGDTVSMLSQVDPLFSSLKSLPLKRWVLIPKEIKDQYYVGRSS